MFKPGRWRGEKSKMKALFKLQFHATQVIDIGVEELVLSIVNNESGKPELRSEKATVTDGVCKWKNPVFESVTFNKELRSGKISQKIYHFDISTGSARGSSVGEVSIDLADYADAVKPLTVSVPLRSSSSNNNGILHVSILRVQGNGNPRETEDALDTNLKMYDDGKLKPRSSNASDSESLCSRSSETTSAPHEDNRKFDWEWSFDQTSKTETAEIERLKIELAAMSRKVDLSDLELQTLRKQIMKQNKKGQDLLRQVSGLRVERDLIIDGGDSKNILEEVRKELNLEKETNSNLRTRNAELVLAVRELEEMLEKASDLSRNARCRSDRADGAQSTLENVELEKEEREMLMEQMALEFEILKQENHDLLSKLEQSELKEELNVAAELEEEMEDQAREFAADLEEITQGKVEQEKRAIKAEEALNKMRFENRKTAARLQEDLRKLAKQMDLIFMEKDHEIEAKSRELEKIRDELKLSDLEKQNLRKQVSRLKEEVTKKNNGRTPGLNLRGIKEIDALKEKIRSLEKQIQLKESKLESTRKGFIEKEKEMQNKIEELERKLEEFRQRNGEKATSLNIEDVLTGSLEERNSSMEDELKNLQEISLKFAEVEGEWQQLMITS